MARNLGIVGMFTFIQRILICVLKDVIQSVEDLVVKKVSTGPPGSVHHKP
jgi:TRAP-type uncharacterized transport system substrate-binding protein